MERQPSHEHCHLFRVKSGAGRQLRENRSVAFVDDNLEFVLGGR